MDLSFHGKTMLLMLLKEATRLNWELVASLDLSSASSSLIDDEHSIDVDAWFFRFKGVPTNPTTETSRQLISDEFQCAT